MRFRVAEPAVELKHLRAVGGEQEAGIKQALERDALGVDAAHERKHDFAMHAIVQFLGEQRRRAERAHASGVRAGIVIEGALVILRRRTEQVARAVHERVDRALGAAQKLLNHDLPARRAELSEFHHPVDRLRGGVRVFRNDDALAEREAVGLDDDRVTQLLAECVSLLAFGKMAERGGRNAVAFHEILRKNLRPLEACAGFRRTENPEAGLLENIRDSGGQRVIGADDGEVDFFVAGEFQKRLRVGDFQRHVARDRGGARVSGSADDFPDAWRLFQFPGERVFASAAADDEDFHIRA